MSLYLMTSLCVISRWCHHNQVAPRTTCNTRDELSKSNLLQPDSISVRWFWLSQTSPLLRPITGSTNWVMGGVSSLLECSSWLGSLLLIFSDKSMFKLDMILIIVHFPLLLKLLDQISILQKYVFQMSCVFIIIFFSLSFFLSSLLFGSLGWSCSSGIGMVVLNALPINKNDKQVRLNYGSWYHLSSPLTVWSALSDCLYACGRCGLLVIWLLQIGQTQKMNIVVHYQIPLSGGFHD